MANHIPYYNDLLICGLLGERTLLCCCLQPRTDQQQPDSENTNATEAAAGTKTPEQRTLRLCQLIKVCKLRLMQRMIPLTGAAEVPSSPQETATTHSEEWHSVPDTEVTPSQTPSDSNNVEASRDY